MSDGVRVMFWQAGPIFPMNNIRSAGFTLLEILAGIVIFSLIGGIGIMWLHLGTGGLQRAIENSRREALFEEMRLVLSEMLKSGIPWRLDGERVLEVEFEEGRGNNLKSLRVAHWNEEGRIDWTEFYRRKGRWILQINGSDNPLTGKGRNPTLEIEMDFDWVQKPGGWIYDNNMIIKEGDVEHRGELDGPVRICLVADKGEGAALRRYFWVYSLEETD